MNKQEGRKFHWRVFLVAWVGFASILLYLIYLQTSFEGNYTYSLSPSLTYRIISTMYQPIFFMFDLVPLNVNWLLELSLGPSLYSLLIERAYYFIRKAKKNKQEGDLKA